MFETEFCATKSIPVCDPGVHIGTTFLLKPKASIIMPVKDRGKGARLVTFKKRVHVANYVDNSGVDKSTYLTKQEHLQHAWDITFPHPGQLGYHTNTVYKHKPSMLLTQVRCSFTHHILPWMKTASSM